MGKIVATGKCDPPERADELIEQQKALLEERNATVKRLDELDPAASAASN